MPGSRMEGLEFAVNSEGVRVKKCCASCQYKVCTNNDTNRKCTLSGKRVTKDFLCRSWRISDFMDNVRIGYNK